MFVRYFVELPVTPDLVVEVTRHPHSWLLGLAERSTFRGDTLLADVGFGEEVRIARRVAIELGEAVSMGRKTVVSLHWRPDGVPGLFPTLEADLEIAPLESSQTQLAISARYRPPMGTLGRAIDRALLSRVAEATIKDFLDGVRDAILRQVGSAAVEPVGQAIEPTGVSGGQRLKALIAQRCSGLRQTTFTSTDLLGRSSER